MIIPCDKLPDLDLTESFILFAEDLNTRFQPEMEIKLSIPYFGNEVVIDGCFFNNDPVNVQASGLVSAYRRVGTCRTEEEAKEFIEEILIPYMSFEYPNIKVIYEDLEED